MMYGVDCTSFIIVFSRAGPFLHLLVQISHQSLVPFAFYAFRLSLIVNFICVSYIVLWAFDPYPVFFVSARYPTPRMLYIALYLPRLCIVPFIA